MESLLIALSPFVVSLITHLAKGLPTINSLSDGYHKAALRMIAGAFSFAGIVATAWLSGQEVDVMSVQTFANALLAFIGSQGVFFLFRR